MEGINPKQNKRVSRSSGRNFSWKTGVHERAEGQRVINLALLEAEALAWQSGVPELLFVTLAEEKVREARKWVARQQQFRLRQFTALS